MLGTTEGEVLLVPGVVPREVRDALAMMGTIPVGGSSPSDGDPLAHMRGRKPSGIASDPYRMMRGLEDVAEGDRVDSWWNDKLALADSRARANRGLASPVLRSKDDSDPDRPWAGTERDIAEAEERLRIARAIGATELRDLSSSGNPFVPARVAVHVATEFAVAARARASLFAALPQLPLRCRLR